MKERRLEKIYNDMAPLVATATKGTGDPKRDAVDGLVRRIINDEEASLVFIMSFPSAFALGSFTKNGQLGVFEGAPLMVMATTHISVSDFIYHNRPLLMDHIGEYQGPSGTVKFSMRSSVVMRSPNAANSMITNEPWHLYEESNVTEGVEKANIAEAIAIGGLVMDFRFPYVQVVSRINELDKSLLPKDVKAVVMDSLDGVTFESTLIIPRQQFVILTPEMLVKMNELKEQLRGS